MIVIFYSMFRKLNIDFNYYFKNLPWVLGGRVVISFFSLLLIVVFTHFSEKEILGKYQLLISIFSLVSIFSLPGFNTSIFESVAKGLDGVYEKGVRMSAKWSMFGVPILLVVGVVYFLKGQADVGLSLVFGSILFPVLFSF